MKIIITIDEGLVDWVQTDASEPVEVMIRNLDIGGCDESEITKALDDDYCDAYVRMESHQPVNSEQLAEFQKIWNHFKPKE